MKKDAVFDLDMTNRLVPFLVEECTKRPRASLWKTIESFSAYRPRSPLATGEPVPSANPVYTYLVTPKSRSVPLPGYKQHLSSHDENSDASRHER
jgi:hypothetical protein